MKNIDTLKNQTQTKIPETFIFKMTKPSNTFSSDLPLYLKGNWVKCSNSLAVNFSVFNIFNEKINFKI